MRSDSITLVLPFHEYLLKTNPGNQNATKEREKNETQVADDQCWSMRLQSTDRSRMLTVCIKPTASLSQTGQVSISLTA